MTLWFDVTDLYHWQVSHLTGIPRTVVGIHNGLVALGHEVRLFRYRKDDRRVVVVTPEDLPVAICLALGGTPLANPRETQSSAAMASGVESRASSGSVVSQEHRLKRALRHHLLGFIGRHPSCGELVSSLVEWGRAGRRLARACLSLMLAPLMRPRALREPSAPTTPALVTPEPDPSLPVSGGDIVFAVGSTGLPSSVIDDLQARGARIVRLLYDMIPALKPQWVKPRDTTIFTAWARDVMRHSDLLLAISRFTASEARRFCRGNGLVAPPITPIRLADVIDQALLADSPAPPTFMPERPFFLCVCTLDIRKNHRLLYDTWTKLQAEYPEDCPDLILIGTEHYFMSDFIREIEHDPVVGPRLRWLKNVSDEDLGWYYRNCLATIYPSKYEGWGLPVAESLANGKVCLSSNASSMPEISDLPLFFSPWSRDELADLVCKVWRDEAARQALETRIRQDFKPTTWVDTASEIMNALEREMTPPPASSYGTESIN